eukprot:EG_transcript_31572
MRHASPLGQPAAHYLAHATGPEQLCSNVMCLFMDVFVQALCALVIQPDLDSITPPCYTAFIKLILFSRFCFLSQPTTPSALRPGPIKVRPVLGCIHPPCRNIRDLLT